MFVADLDRPLVEDLEGLRRGTSPRPRRTSSRVRRGRSSFWPVGSPTIAVKSPTRKIAVCPRSWNCRIFCEQHGVAEVQIGARRVEAGLHAERLAAGVDSSRRSRELGAHVEVDDAAREERELLGDRKEAHGMAADRASLEASGRTQSSSSSSSSPPVIAQVAAVVDELLQLLADLEERQALGRDGRRARPCAGCGRSTACRAGR